MKLGMKKKLKTNNCEQICNGDFTRKAAPFQFPIFQIQF